jgi:hypothetical protein
VPLFVIFYCGFLEDRAMDCDRGECEFFCDLTASELGSFVKCFPLDPFSDKT